MGRNILENNMKNIKMEITPKIIDIAFDNIKSNPYKVNINTTGEPKELFYYK